MKSGDEERELEAVERVLEQASEDRRALLEAACRDADDADARAMERAFDSAAHGPRRARTGIRRGWLAVAVAAAIALFVMTFGRDDADPGEGPSGILLGRPELRLVSPVGEVPAYGILRWDLSSDDAASFTIRVRDPASGATLLAERVEGQTSLTPSSRESAGWPHRIELEVTAFDDAGEPLATCSGSAWLGP